jgi:glycosyltransferase involved in cell wall biosynthesis
MKFISVVTPCYNEEQNIQEIYQQVKAVFKELPSYQYEHIFIDNASTDKTVEILRSLAKTDKNLKVIVNARNFGPVRSPFYGLLQAHGDAVIYIVADLQDPPTMIKDFIAQWETGYKIVVGVKSESHEFPLFFFIRKLYYKFIAKISDVKLIKNFTGFGLYDKAVIDILRKLDDPYPYFRGLISELGFKTAEIPFKQPPRMRGCSKANFYLLYDWAMLGITSHSKVPIRLATMAGFLLSIISLSISLIFLLLKLLFWESFGLGIAPILIGLFFFSSIQLFFIGLLGEYIASIHTRIMKRPLVIEEERINF